MISKTVPSNSKLIIIILGENSFSEHFLLAPEDLIKENKQIL